MADFETDESMSEETIKNNLELFLDYICDCVDATDLLVHLPVFSREQRKEIFLLSTTRKQEATKRAIKVIQNTSDQNKYRAFMEVVQTNKYSKVVRILAGKHTPNDENCRKIVDIFMPELVGRLMPFELLPWLKRYNVLQEKEAEMIRAEETNHGPRRACWLLLHYLPCREKNWFKYFLMALIKCKLKDLAQKLDPDLYEKLIVQMNDREEDSLPSMESLSLWYSEFPEPTMEHVVSDKNTVDVDNENAASKKTQDMKEENCLQDKSDDLKKDCDSDSGLLDFSELEIAESKMMELKETNDQSQEPGIDTAAGETNDSFVEQTVTEVIEKDAIENTKESDEKKTDHLEDFSNLTLPQLNAQTVHQSQDKDGKDKIQYTREFLLAYCNSPLTQYTPTEILKFPEIQLRRHKKDFGTQNFNRFNGNGKHFTTKRMGGPASELTLRKDISNEKKAPIDTQETFVKVVENFDALLEQPDHNDTTEVKQVTDSTSANENLLDLTDEFEKLLLEDLKAEKESGDAQNDLSIDTDAVAYDETGFNIETDDDTIPDIEDKDIGLRNYQKELAREGSAGENVIVMAPTNSGKTRVACAVMQAHLRKCKRDHIIGRVIFIVENEALAGQQGVVCAEQLPAYRTKVISGTVQRDKQQYLKDFVDRRDILVVTAQVLVNALKDKEIESVTCFSMIVFDECHHTNASHPYNQIMSKYMDIKLNKNMDPSVLPQIVGLTASIGVGGKTDEKAAKKHMKNIMANMDASYLCTVRQNVDELRVYKNPPVEETVTVKGRVDDIFSVTIRNCVEQINRMMVKHPCMAQLEKTDRAKFANICQIPPCIGSEQFIQWLSNFKKGIGAISSDEARRILNPCWHNLEVYNKALMIHKDARVKEARAVLHIYMEDQIEHNTMKDNTDEQLLDLYTRVQNIDYNSIPENPKLIRLQKLILDVLKHDPNARGIIFVKTRELARALINWTKETPELSPLNASEFVGQVAAASAGGMTKSGQRDKLEYFKDGKHKLIIATSVAEEGLDIAKCNLVIRYEHVTNEIVRLQSRGRARAESSKYYVLTEPGSWIAAKEEKNAMLEHLMKQLVPVVQQEIELHQREWHREMKEMQKEAKEEERSKEKEKEAKKMFGPCQLQCLNCGSFICWVTDVKQIQNAHHVVVNDAVKERIVTVRSPFPMFEESELKYDGAVYCLKCVYDLGGVCEYKSVEFPLLKVRSLRMEDQDGNGFTKKKWKDVPFYVEKFTLDDLRVIVDRKLME